MEHVTVDDEVVAVGVRIHPLFAYIGRIVADTNVFHPIALQCDMVGGIVAVDGLPIPPRDHKILDRDVRRVV